MECFCSTSLGVSLYLLTLSGLRITLLQPSTHLLAHVGVSSSGANNTRCRPAAERQAQNVPAFSDSGFPPTSLVLILRTPLSKEQSLVTVSRLAGTPFVCTIDFRAAASRALGDEGWEIQTRPNAPSVNKTGQPYETKHNTKDKK